MYRGRAQFRAPVAVSAGKAGARARKEAAKRQTIAERKAAEKPPTWRGKRPDAPVRKDKATSGAKGKDS